ncbi:MAG: methyltransferase domain-containing protein [Planctomycetes bacterium]|nr:methyltransferase domain-containing protein [Planctomycetota bacterium]
MRDATGIDFGRRSDDYARLRPGFPDSFYDRLETHLSLADTTALDLGTGPGVVALALARRGARVTGLDIAPNQIRAARRRATDLGLDDLTEFHARPAEDTQVPDTSVDLVIAGQCWGWFDHDRALAEVVRVLRPGGRHVIAHFCYLPGRSAVAARTEHLILQHNPGWTMSGRTGIYGHYIDQMQRLGMQLVEQFCYDTVQPFTHEQWRGRIRTSNGVGSGVMSDEQVDAFDDALAALLAEEFPEEPLLIEHRVWAAITRKPAGPAP